MMSFEQPNLNTVIFPDTGRSIDTLYQNIGIYMDADGKIGGVSFETIAREILSFATDCEGNVFYSPPINRYPGIDWQYFTAKVHEWAAILRSMPEMKFIEVVYHQNLVNGIEFMVLTFEVKYGVEARWS